MEYVIRRLLTGIIMLSFTIELNAQFEYLVNINYTTGQFTCIDSLKGVKWVVPNPPCSAFDKINSIYYFRGAGSNSQPMLYAVNAITGKCVPKGQYQSPSSTFLEIGGLQFDDSTGTLYGTARLASNLQLYLIRIDTATAIMYTISALPGMTGASQGLNTYDQKRHHYIFFGVLANSTVYKLVTVNALNGAIVFSPTVSLASMPYPPRFNSVTAKLYALLNDTGTVDRIVTIDQQTGQAIATVTTIANWPFGPVSPNCVALNEKDNRLTLLNYAQSKLITIDLSTGNYLATPPFSMGTPTGTNVIELQYNNANGNLHALHWGPKSTTTATFTTVRENANVQDFKWYPNPAGNDRLIYVEGPNFTKIQITNSKGQIVRTAKIINGNTVISLEGLAPDLYFCTATDEEGNHSVKKVIVE